jgi:hypothetical protein
MEIEMGIEEKFSGVRFEDRDEILSPTSRDSVPEPQIFY